jgi:hypothetical protein
MKTAVLLVLMPLTVLAQEFEEPPVLSAGAILRPEFAWEFAIRCHLRRRNGYMIDSEYGIFEADGNAMLVRRMRELPQLRVCVKSRVRTSSRTRLLPRRKSPIGAAKELIQHPVSTVAGVPKGLWKFMNRAGRASRRGLMAANAANTRIQTPRN